MNGLSLKTATSKIKQNDSGQCRSKQKDAVRIDHCLLTLVRYAVDLNLAIDNHAGYDTGTRRRMMRRSTRETPH